MYIRSICAKSVTLQPSYVFLDSVTQNKDCPDVIRFCIQEPTMRGCERYIGAQRTPSARIYPVLLPFLLLTR